MTVLGAVTAALVSALMLTSPAAGAQLPDARAYEMVSPPGKNGAEVIQQTAKTHVAADGNGVTFSTLSGFGDVQGTSLDAEHLSRRTGTPGTNGWSTQGINPPGASDTVLAVLLGNNNTYVNAFTPDLSAAIYRSWRPLVNAPNVADVSNLYRITGLGERRSTAELMSDGVTPVPAWPTNFKLLIRPAFVGASTDLSHVVFESTLPLTTDAPPQGPVCASLGLACPTGLYENVGGAVRLVGRIPNAPDTTCDDLAGPPCVTAPSSQAGISASPSLKFYSETMVSDDGRRILFQTPAGADSGTIYMRQDGVRTVQLAQNGELWGASADGSRSFFTTSDSLVGDDTDSNPDLYMYDTTTADHLTLVSASSVNDGNVESVVGTSADGHYVYFVCDGQLVPGEPPADTVGLYVWHDGALRYIGHFVDPANAQRNGPRASYDFASVMSTARVSPDGRHLLFMSQDDAGFRDRGGFAGYDHAGHREQYLYDADTGRLACASCNPSGRAATVDALLNVRDGAAASETTSKLSHALSDDGRRVFFTTAEALVPEDTNATLDAYEYDAPSGTVHLLSSGTDPSPSYFIDASDDGDNAFLVTRQRLVGWDVDDSYDLYDARVHGGFPEPVPPASQCTGEACLGESAPAPAAGSAASTEFRGAGNAAGRLRRQRRCGRRAVLKRVRGKKRCVRRRSHKHRARHAQVTDERPSRRR